ncbi:isopentenyl-diphosphate delta-isomerase idi1, partial [Perkinsus olseni]
VEETRWVSDLRELRRLPRSHHYVFTPWFDLLTKDEDCLELWWPTIKKTGDLGMITDMGSIRTKHEYNFVVPKYTLVLILLTEYSSLDESYRDYVLEILYSRGFFESIPPIPGAIQGVKLLASVPNVKARTSSSALLPCHLRHQVQEFGEIRYNMRAKARLRLDGWFTTLEEAEVFV